MRCFRSTTLSAALLVAASMLAPRAVAQPVCGFARLGALPSLGEDPADTRLRESLRSVEMERKSVGRTEWPSAHEGSVTRMTSTTGDEFLVEEVFQCWDGSAWDNFSRYLYTYKGGLEVERVFQEWDGSTWADDSRELYAYEGDLLVEGVSQYWDGSAWVNLSRYLYTYKGGLLAERLIQRWDGSAWADNGRALFAYEGDLLVETVVQGWDGSARGNSSRRLYTYEGDLLVEWLFQFWKGSVWGNSFRQLYTYEGGLEVEVLRQAWDGSAWVDVRRELYAYEGDLLVEGVSQNWDGSAWDNFSRYLFTYGSPISVEEPTVLPEQLRLSAPAPNPSAGTTTIAYTLASPANVRLTVYDVLGREIAVLADGVRPAGEHRAAMEAARLAPGVYVLRLAAEGEVATRRLTVVR